MLLAAAHRVLDPQLDLDVGERAPEDPGPAIDRTPVEHLDQQLHVGRREEPEQGRVGGLRHATPDAGVAAARVAPGDPHPVAAAQQHLRRRAGESRPRRRPRPRGGGRGRSRERRRVGHRRLPVRGDAAPPLLAARRVRDRHPPAHRGGGTGQHPEAAVHRPPVEHLHQQLEVVRGEEPEGPGVRRQRVCPGAAGEVAGVRIDEGAVDAETVSRPTSQAQVGGSRPARARRDRGEQPRGVAGHRRHPVAADGEGVEGGRPQPDVERIADRPPVEIEAAQRHAVERVAGRTRNPLPVGAPGGDEPVARGGDTDVLLAIARVARQRRRGRRQVVVAHRQQPEHPGAVPVVAGVGLAGLGEEGEAPPALPHRHGGLPGPLRGVQGRVAGRGTGAQAQALVEVGGVGPRRGGGDQVVAGTEGDRVDEPDPEVRGERPGGTQRSPGHVEETHQELGELRLVATAEGVPAEPGGPDDHEAAGGIDPDRGRGRRAAGARGRPGLHPAVVVVQRRPQRRPVEGPPPDRLRRRDEQRPAGRRRDVLERAAPQVDRGARRPRRGEPAGAHRTRVALLPDDEEAARGMRHHVAVEGDGRWVGGQPPRAARGDELGGGRGGEQQCRNEDEERKGAAAGETARHGGAHREPPRSRSRRGRSRR